MYPVNINSYDVLIALLQVMCISHPDRKKHCVIPFELYNVSVLSVALGLTSTMDELWNIIITKHLFKDGSKWGRCYSVVNMSCVLSSQ